MNLKFLALPVALALALAGCASGSRTDLLAPDTPRALPESGPVSVRWTDPAEFTELRNSNNRYEAARGPWLTDLAEYLRDRATALLPPGERLEIVITDVDRAGDYEPWRSVQAQDTRIVRDIYPPRMTVQFRRLDASGAVIAEGERKLTDPGFLLGPTPINSSDPLRYEKKMIDDWLRREFGTSAR